MSAFNLNSTPYLNEKVYNVKNGRVITNHSDNSNCKKDFILFEGNDNKNDSFKMKALSGIQIMSPLSALFFSNVNMQRIQDLIRHGVYVRSNKKYIISEQSVTELQIIMRAVYLQHAKGMSTNMKQQIIDLNNIIVSWSVPKIMSEIEQHRGYIHDIENLPVPLEHPTNLSSAGTRALRSVTTTF